MTRAVAVTGADAVTGAGTMADDRALGIDFGTSNSTVAMGNAGAPQLLALEDDHFNAPSAVFFNFETGSTEYGRHAVQSYVDDHDGRFMRALKSVLGSPLMDEQTTIRGKRLRYTEIIAGYVAWLKRRAEAVAGRPFDRVLAGRPVHFVDDDVAADHEAERALGEIYRLAGFKDVAFQFEPIAAALDYERQVRAEEIVLIADLGGGTSDFSLVRVSPEASRKADRSEDILATSGVHVGGTDLDRLVSLDRVMPLLGMGSELRRDFAKGTLTTPRHVYMSLSTWQQIHRLYDRKVLDEVKDYRRRAEAPHLIERLQRVLDHRLGHKLILAIELAKITLTDAQMSAIDLHEVERDLAECLAVDDFNALIENSAQRIRGALEACIADAGLRRERIAAVFFTGGTAAIPLIRRSLSEGLPHAAVVDGDRFGSVGTGLAIEAGRIFR